MLRLDTLDHRLIAELRENGRAPVSTLAATLKVSRATVQTRMDRLLETGAIMGFTVRAQSDTNGQSVRAVMLIEVAGRSTTAVIRRLRGLPELRSLYTTNGAWDLVADISAATLADFDRVLREVRTVDGVLNSETSILLSSIE